MKPFNTSPSSNGTMVVAAEDHVGEGVANAQQIEHSLDDVLADLPDETLDATSHHGRPENAVRVTVTAEPDASTLEVAPHRDPTQADTDIGLRAAVDEADATAGIDVPAYFDALVASEIPVGPPLNLAPPSGPPANLAPLVDEPATKPTLDPHVDLNKAIDEASAIRLQAAALLSQTQAQAQALLDSAQRRAAATVSQTDEQAAQVIEAALEQAAFIVAVAEQRQLDMMAETDSAVDLIRKDAERAAREAVEEERAAYKLKATEVAEAAINDSRLLIENAERRAEELVEQARAEAQGMLSDAVTALGDIEDEAKDKVTSLVQPATSKVIEAEQAAEATHEKAMAKAAELRERSVAQTDALLADAHSQSETKLAAIENLKIEAQDRFSKALATAAKRGRAAAQSEVEAQMSDVRRTAAELERNAAATLHKADSDAARMRREAKAEANAIISAANQQAAAMTKEAIMAADSIKSSAQIQVDQLTASGHEACAELVHAGNDHTAELIAEAEAERTRAQVHHASVSLPSAQISGAATFTDFEYFGDFEEFE
ncbi:MAG: hypothetical protein HOK58_04300 [Acidimicrobiaceae bacterium]|nr:hypothetical protein [Acidimicrobiaceae bacterium]